MSRLMIITTPDWAPGYQLAGVESFAAQDSVEAAAKLRELLAGGEASLIAVRQELLQGIDSRLQRQIDTSLRPIVIAIPGAATATSAELRARYISELIRRAIGFHITIGGDTARAARADGP